MREAIELHTLRCENQVTKLARALAPIKGLNEARVEFGNSVIVVDYDDEARERVETALTNAGFGIGERNELPAPTLA